MLTLCKFAFFHLLSRYLCTSFLLRWCEVKLIISDSEEHDDKGGTNVKEPGSEEQGESGSDHVGSEHENQLSDRPLHNETGRKSPADGDGAGGEVGSTNKPLKADEFSEQITGKGKAGKNLHMVKKSKHRHTDADDSEGELNVRRARSRSRRIESSDSESPAEHVIHKRRPRKRYRTASRSPRRRSPVTKALKHRRSLSPSLSRSSDSEELSTCHSSSSSSDNYQAYSPTLDSKVCHWRLSHNSSKYAAKHFSTYMEEAMLKDTLTVNPKPSHSFLKVEEMDPRLETGLPDKVGAGQANVVLNRDKNFCRIQEKIQRVMGPLGKLWKDLDKGRKHPSERKINLAKVLQLAKKSVCF